MGLENRRRSIEKSDLQSFNEMDSSTKTTEDLKDIKDLLDLLGNELDLFTEQEAGKATINASTIEKENAKTYDQISSKEMLDKIQELFG